MYFLTFQPEYVGRLCLNLFLYIYVYIYMPIKIMSIKNTVTMCSEGKEKNNV